MAGVNAIWIGVMVLAVGLVLWWWVRKSERSKID